MSDTEKEALCWFSVFEAKRTNTKQNTAELCFPPRHRSRVALGSVSIDALRRAPVSHRTRCLVKRTMVNICSKIGVCVVFWNAKAWSWYVFWNPLCYAWCLSFSVWKRHRDMGTRCSMQIPESAGHMSEFSRSQEFDRVLSLQLMGLSFSTEWLRCIIANATSSSANGTHRTHSIEIRRFARPSNTSTRQKWLVSKEQLGSDPLFVALLFVANQQ